MIPGSCNDGSCDSDTGATGSSTRVLHVEMMYGFASLLVMIVMSAFSINYIRRRYFEAFYYVNQLFRLMIIFFAFITRTMLFLLPGVVIILIDKTVGYLSLIGLVEAKAHPCTKDIFEMKVRKDPNTRCEAGQYVFVNVPSVSLLEWHPIAVTWAAEYEMALHIKARRGPKTWTQLVFDEVCAKGGLLNVKLDGFYGSNQIEANSFLKKEAVLLFCGGCGLTFPFSIIMELGWECLGQWTSNLHNRHSLLELVSAPTLQVSLKRLHPSTQNM